MSTNYISLKLMSSKTSDFAGYTYDLIVSFIRSLYVKAYATHAKKIVTNEIFNQSGSWIMHKIKSGVIIKSIKYFVRYNSKDFKSINVNISKTKEIAITKYKLKTNLGLAKNNLNTI